ncbi:MAG TPA: hypothetical protein VHP58_02360 [Alphaproteobacteria bacterium]|nr:hypothetical protein [Alphaproteobacteria bacterium]
MHTFYRPPVQANVENNMLPTTPYQRLLQALHCRLQHNIRGRGHIGTTSLRNMFHHRLPQWKEVEHQAAKLGYKLGPPTIYEDRPDELVDIRVEVIPLAA